MCLRSSIKKKAETSGAIPQKIRAMPGQQELRHTVGRAACLEEKLCRLLTSRYKARCFKRIFHEETDMKRGGTPFQEATIF